MKNKPSRRTIIKSALATGVSPFLFNGCSTGFSANRRLNIAVVGYGRIAHTMDVPNCTLVKVRRRTVQQRLQK